MAQQRSNLKQRCWCPDKSSYNSALTQCWHQLGWVHTPQDHEQHNCQKPNRTVWGSMSASHGGLRVPTVQSTPSRHNPRFQSPGLHQLLAAAATASYARSCTATARPEGSSLPAQAASHSAAVAVLHATDGPPGTVSAAAGCEKIDSKMLL